MALALERIANDVERRLNAQKCTFRHEKRMRFNNIIKAIKNMKMNCDLIDQIDFAEGLAGRYENYQSYQEEKWGKTHTLKRKLTKDEYKSWTKEQKDNNPIAGYFEPWRPREGSYNNSGSGYQQNSYAPQTPPPPTYAGQMPGGADDLSDMPF